ncbi:hypothetical protein JOQ06_013771 [Pogonophryne albipinna]|uniref:SERRATE/Ars2 C-terminal domain-containing protein n=1 Tax=Pogonophryne albipinna TaxID=1090488 RepID=A0AAD6BJI6_9TELE|nr:hypothetical protein JOQ06_013771 [Pogonophryne albipinna]
MEGGTDLDLQVLEAPAAGGQGGTAGGTAEGEKSPAEPIGGEKSPAEPMEGEKSPAEPMGEGARTSEDRKRKRSVSVDSEHRKDRGGDRKEREKELCRRYPGFLRVALSDPQPERRFFRRCWVTFDRSVNIKETCWNLQNIRLRDSEDLCRRVRCVNGLTHHRPVVRNDIRLSARLIHSLDLKGALWQGHMETNPFLKNITDFLIEEVSAEEEELIGASGGNEEDKDPASSSEVLDRLLLYLRLVHSVDYYNFCEYPAEDEMPHRLSEHQKMCEERLAPLFSVSESLSEEEAAKLGKKDPEQEVEKFLVANSQELSKDKWLCPLSGKKFKAPEFVRKHILNKHGDKVSAVRQEVVFFNNFLLDAKRPALPENKPLPPPQGSQGMTSFPGQSPQQQSLLGYPPGVRPPMPGFPGGGPPYNPNQGVRGDPRSIIEYRDLDAPDDLDFF